MTLCVAEAIVTEAPTTRFVSWEQFLEVDGGTAEDCKDIIETGHQLVCGMSYRLTKQDVIDFLEDKAYKHDHTTGDHMLLKHETGKTASLFGAGKLRL